MNKLYDLLKYIIYASFYMIVIKTGMDFYGYKRFPKLYESYSAPCRSITVYRCPAFRDCRMFCAQSNHWTKDEEEVSYMFMLFEFMFPIIFVMVFGMIIFQFVTGIGTWHKNNQSPRLSVSATIVAKRENITHHNHANAGDLSGTHGYHSTSSTSYYVTFQVESGDRMELPVSGREYGMLAEGDIGKLTFQGTRYLSFERV